MHHAWDSNLSREGKVCTSPVISMELVIIIFLKGLNPSNKFGPDKLHIKILKELAVSFRTVTIHK